MKQIIRSISIGMLGISGICFWIATLKDLYLWQIAFGFISGLVLGGAILLFSSTFIE